MAHRTGSAGQIRDSGRIEFRAKRQGPGGPRAEGARPANEEGDRSPPHEHAIERGFGLSVGVVEVNASMWLMALALPLAAPPKLLINAKLESASAAAGLDRAFRPLVSAQPQPAWIGYTVPLARG